VTAGREWNVVKLRPDGTAAARYPATEIDAPPGWVAVRAVWGFGSVDIGYFTFEPGDILLEFFSLERPYNAFATFRPTGELAGWYSNVTHPTTVTEDEIRWHDLWVDVLLLPDGKVIVVDEDELAEAGVAASDPALHQMILVARDELIQLIEDGAYPFSESTLPVGAGVTREL
jgi:protein associated with RNAse G/E